MAVGSKASQAHCREACIGHSADIKEGCVGAILGFLEEMIF